MEDDLKSSEVQIVEKPDWVSWEDIKQCLYEAHATNRAKGINMAHYQWPVERFVQSLGNKWKMFVALDGKSLVGVAGYCEKDGKPWFVNEPYAYMCFAGVLPDYNGKGIYTSLLHIREVSAISDGYGVLAFDTHLKNKKIQNAALKNDYRYVRFFQAASKDHYSVVMAKWVKECPYSKFYCGWKYQVSKLRTLFITKILHK